MSSSILKTLVENDALVRGLESLSGTKPVQMSEIEERMPFGYGMREDGTR